MGLSTMLVRLAPPGRLILLRPFRAPRARTLIFFVGGPSSTSGSDPRLGETKRVVYDSDGGVGVLLSPGRGLTGVIFLLRAKIEGCW